MFKREMAKHARGNRSLGANAYTVTQTPASWNNTSANIMMSAGTPVSTYYNASSVVASTTGTSGKAIGATA